MRGRLLSGLLIGLFALSPAYGYGNDPLPIHGAIKIEDEEKPWQEAEAKLPDFPKDEDLLEFYVSAITTNRFFIDGKTLAANTDGVVRFSLVVKAAGGAVNVSYEGIRCGTGEARLYAVGVQGAWVPSRTSTWKLIENKLMNRHHAALSRDYFCPASISIRSAEEGRNALRLGKHPDAL